jgi:hypothetical protein
MINVGNLTYLGLRSIGDCDELGDTRTQFWYGNRLEYGHLKDQE